MRSAPPTLVLAAALVSCTGEAGPEPTLPDVTQAKFVVGVDHPYFPLKVGAKWTYEAMGEDGTEHIEVEVLAETREIQGVTAVVVKDTATVNGAIIEDTRDWYAQDDQGNVWYLGEDTCEYTNGMCTNRHGAWEWGQGGALPGIIMPATPTVDGQPYRQEYDPGNAEDIGEVVELGVKASVPTGDYTDCIKTRDTSTLETDVEEYKYYCRGVGLVLTEEPEATEKLIAFSG